MHKTKTNESQLYDESYDNKEHKSNKLISPLLDLGPYLTNLRRFKKINRIPSCISLFPNVCYEFSDLLLKWSEMDGF